MSEIYRVKSITDLHQMLGIQKPKHPLVSVITDFGDQLSANEGVKFTTDLYSISLKEDFEGTIFYGRNTYDFQEGTLIFLKPNQVAEYDLGNEAISHERTWALVFHPDLIRKSELGKIIDRYKFFDYEAREALHLSEDEKKSIEHIVLQIKKEIDSNIDQHSQELITSNIKLVLDYCTRYFDRQFYTRTNLNQDIVSKFELLLNKYYDSGLASEIGLPSVNHLGNELSLSPYYLSDLLKKETGRNTIEHIHFFIIEKAKNSLLGSEKSISEIAYDLGFEYPQHFSKLFKNKTGMSPKEYRNSN